jgi:hypothetical protein
VRHGLVSARLQIRRGARLDSNAAGAGAVGERRLSLGEAGVVAP